MRVAGIRELRAHSAALVNGREPVVVTRHGKISGLYLPLDEPDRLPDDLRRELSSVLGRHLAKLLKKRGVSDRDLAADFRTHRRSRR